MDADVLTTAHEAFGRRAWTRAHELYARADRAAPLPPADLERMAVAAYMAGRDEEQLAALERAHRALVGDGDRPGAARTAFWLGVHLLLRGEAARAAGWHARARRLLEGADDDCVEQGYVDSGDALRHLIAGDRPAARASAQRAVAAGERHGDADLVALGLIDLGQALIEDGLAADGLGRLDEAMVAALAGELSPVVTGFVYCGVIAGCHAADELGRAVEWTAALADWCAGQPDLVPFTGTCLLHRAEILQIHGRWDEALAEALTACARFADRRDRRAAGEASYRCGEILRVRGDLAAAERAFRDASRNGRDPQPGLALLRLAQGRPEAACAAVTGALDAADGWSGRARLLPAFVEVLLAVGRVDAAGAAAAELQAIAGRHGRTTLVAAAAHARGAVLLAAGDARAAAAPLRRAAGGWLALGAAYEAARARLLVAEACRALGDDETARLERAAAHGDLARLGARIDRGRTGEGLTPRELQVLRRLACGDSNKEIAARLGVSRRTVDRHVGNLYGKLRVSSRAAATAWAYEHDVV